MQTKTRKTVAYPARASVTKSRKISNYRRGYKWIDIVCQTFITGAVIGTMAGMVIYANERDTEYFKTQYISSVPTRPEECIPEDNCEDPIVYGM